MVRIRLRRIGAKKQPSYRVVAADKEAPRDGRFLEILGFYNPRTEPATIQLKEDRIYDWMSKGAQPSDSVFKLFRTVGLLERYERFKKGEELDKLLEEAKAGEAKRNINSKTQRPQPVKSKKAKKKDVVVEEAEEAPKASEPDAVSEEDNKAVAEETSDASQEEATEETTEEETTEEANEEESEEA